MCLAIPGRVETVRDDDGLRMGRVNFGGVVKEVCLACLPDAAVGDYAIVHAGFAITRIDEEAAREMLRSFAELGVLAEGLAELADHGTRLPSRDAAPGHEVTAGVVPGQPEPADAGAQPP